jgi:putative DNA primase/helicase
MNSLINDSANLAREQREQREQFNACNSSEHSQQSKTDENSENNANLKIENPVDTEPRIVSTVDINRPCFMLHVDWVEVQGKKIKPGLYFHHEVNSSDGRRISVDEWICSPLQVLAISSSVTGDDFGRLLRFSDSNGKWHEWAMPMYMLKSNGDELCGELLNQGLIFDHKYRKKMIHYIMSTKPNRRVIAACTIGWHESVFVLPNQVIGSEDIVFQSEIAGESEFTTAGTLDEWQQYIGKYCEGNIPLMVSVSTSLAGALLKRVNRQQGGAVHWVGDSSTGKSTTAEVAATIWSSPDFIRSWSTTANGFEGIAAARNDTCIILDEINEASPLEVGRIVYMLGNGQGKQRAGRTGYAKKIQRWRLMAISSGERTLESVMKEAGKQVNSGQAVRLLNIPASFEYGAFSNLHEFTDGRSLADHLKSARLKYYGNIGIAYVHKLVDEKRNLNELLDRVSQKFLAHTASNLEKRAAGIFAVIGLAGELGIEYGLLPWKEGSALEAAYIAFTRWKEFQGAGQTEDQKILNSVRDYIDRHGDSRFSPHDNNEKIYERAGWYKTTDERRVYMFTSVALTEAGGGHDRARIVDTLVRHKWLADKDSDRFTKKTRIGAESKNLYHIHIPDTEESRA